MGQEPHGGDVDSCLLHPSPPWSRAGARKLDSGPSSASGVMEPGDLGASAGVGAEGS